MEKINVMDFEKDILKKYYDDEMFLEFLNENAKRD